MRKPATVFPKLSQKKATIYTVKTLFPPFPLLLQVEIMLNFSISATIVCSPITLPKYGVMPLSVFGYTIL